MSTAMLAKSTATPRASEFVLARPLAWTGACFLVYFLCFYRLADRDLWSSHEARAAQDAQSMLLDREWRIPRLFDRSIDLQKPPLYYWMVAAVGGLRGGVDAWSVRLPSTLAGVAGALCLYGFLVRRGRPIAAIVSGISLITALHYTWSARIGRIDMPLAFADMVCLLAFHEARQSNCRVRAWQVLGFLALACAVMLKGPVGAVLPGVVWVSYLAWNRALPGVRDLRGWSGCLRSGGVTWGLPLVLALSLPWFVWIDAHTNGKFFEVFFWKHNVERGLGGGSLSEHPWWFYGPRLFFDFLPWSPVLPVLCWLGLRRGWWRQDREASLGMVWTLGMLLILSIAKFKRADYLLPVFPGAALLLGCLAESLYRTSARQLAMKVVFVGSLASCGVGWFGYSTWVLPREDARLQQRSFAEVIRRHAPAPNLILFFRAEAHALAFHVGRPLDTLLEWENLDHWVGLPHQYHVVMPAECAEEWPAHLQRGRLERVADAAEQTNGGHHQALVLMRTHAGPR